MNRLWTPWRMNYLENGPPGGGEGCLFCDKIAANDDAAHHVLYRGEHGYVTLNLYPYNNGHLMVVPYAHVPSLEELDTPTLTEIMTLTSRAMQVLRKAYHPEGFNVGINIGAAAGAGVAGHLHQHIVPRWHGDTNYMATLAETRIIPEWIDETYARLRAVWLEIFPQE
jgi:ATP adenylyltransferase